MSTRWGTRSCLIHVPLCSPFKWKACPDLQESPVALRQHRLPAPSRNSRAVSRSIAEISAVRTFYNTTCRCTRSKLQSAIGSPVRGPAFGVSTANQTHGAVNSSRRLAGVSRPQTCSSSCLINVFVSECSGVDVSHCMDVRNNRRIRQHPRSFPTQNMKERSWCTLLLLSLLPLFPLWGWLRAAPGKMTVTLADNVFHPGTHEWQKHVIIFEKECLLFPKAEFYLFFSFQGYLIFLLISHTTSFSCLLLNVVLCHFQAHRGKTSFEMTHFISMTSLGDGCLWCNYAQTFGCLNLKRRSFLKMTYRIMNAVNKYNFCVIFFTDSIFIGFL